MFIDKNAWYEFNEAHPRLQRRKVVLINFCIYINLFELFVNFTNMYLLMCERNAKPKNEEAQKDSYPSKSKGA